MRSVHDIVAVTTLMNAMLDRWCPRSSSDQTKTRYGRHFGVDPTFITRTNDLILHYRSCVSISSSTLGMGFKIFCQFLPLAPVLSAKVPLVFVIA